MNQAHSSTCQRNSRLALVAGRYGAVDQDGIKARSGLAVRLGRLDNAIKPWSASLVVDQAQCPTSSHERFSPMAHCRSTSHGTIPFTAVMARWSLIHPADAFIPVAGLLSVDAFLENTGNEGSRLNESVPSFVPKDRDLSVTPCSRLHKQPPALRPGFSRSALNRSPSAKDSTSPGVWHVGHTAVLGPSATRSATQYWPLLV